MNKYSIAYVDPVSLSQQLGVSYTRLIKYKHENQDLYNEQIERINNVWDASITKRSSMFNLPMLQKYAELSYKDSEGNETKLLLETLVINVSQDIQITTQPVIGLEGTVKQYISDGDYEINITGSIVSDNKFYLDEEKILTLIELKTNGKVIQITNEFLNKFFKVYDIVIKKFDFMESADYVNTVFFTLNCLSDNKELGIINLNN